MVRSYLFCVFLLLSVFLLNSSFVSANFVCGEVVSNTSIAPSWLEVSINYADAPTKMTQCSVSPVNNRYCCDPLDIKGTSWAIGKVVVARSYTPSSPYFALSVNTTITGAGYDLLPVLELKRAFYTTPELEPLYVNINSLMFNVSITSPYNSLSYVLTSQGENRSGSLCTSCSETVLALDTLTAGVYNLTITSSIDGTNQVSETVPITILPSIAFNRTFSCNGCKGNVLPSNKLVNVTLKVTLSQPFEGTVSEIIPLDWEVVGDEDSAPLSDTHQLIQWNSAGTFQTTYTVLTPSTLLTEDYTFQMKFESVSDDLEEVHVYRLLRLPFPLRHKYARYLSNASSTIQVYPLVGPTQPAALLSINNSFVNDIIVYPRKQQKNKLLFFSNSSPVDMSKAKAYFTLAGTIRPYTSMNFTFKVPVGTKQSKIHLYHTTSHNWHEIPFKYVSNDSSYSYYRAQGKYGFYALKY